VVLLNLLIAMLNNSYQLISVSLLKLLYFAHTLLTFCTKICFLYYSQGKNNSNLEKKRTY
jgi:hypothetical protein